MIVVIDANILFSALITPAGKIGDIITHPATSFKMVTCHYAFVELFKHQQKVLKYAKHPEAQVFEIMDILFRNIEFKNEMLIANEYMMDAERLTKAVDHFDMRYVALTLNVGGVLWTGNKKLSSHLIKLGFDRVVSTAELDSQLNII